MVGFNGLMEINSNLFSRYKIISSILCIMIVVSVATTSPKINGTRCIFSSFGLENFESISRFQRSKLSEPSRNKLPPATSRNVPSFSALGGNSQP